VKIYIVRNAQSNGDVLTDIGVRQADRLGRYLQYIGFQGTVCAMPQADTMETARIIADRTGTCVKPWQFVDIQSLLTEYDTVYVCDKAVAQLMIDSLEFPKKNGTLYHCSLSWIDPRNSAARKYMDTGHLSNDLVSDDGYIRKDRQLARLQQRMADMPVIPPEVKDTASIKLLHIGDTPSYSYPYYEALIQRIKPDVLIHTGDFVDEVKVGRIPAFLALEEYETGLARIGEILKNSGAKTVYIVPGNNDIPQLMKHYMPFAQLIEPNTQLTIAGVSCTLGHTCQEATKESLWSFYGHGLTGETWRPEMNQDLAKTCRFNATWGATLILPEEGKLYPLPGLL
jgi:predicted phosphodiesterase